MTQRPTRQRLCLEVEESASLVHAKQPEGFVWNNDRGIDTLELWDLALASE